jgi:murein DD-endopeptidase MepM/ murein hydrolase activator NlpD
VLLHLTTALALTAAGPLPTDPSEWRAPVPERVEVVRPFRPPPGPYAAGHRGVDLAARPEDPVLAAGAGRVSFAGRVAGRGVVVVQHRDGLRTSYEPVAADVTVGDAVTPGTVLGTLGRSTHCLRSCLHWGLRRGTDYLDPMSLLGGGPAGFRLLPLDRLSAGRPAWCAGRASPSSGSARPGSPRPRRARRPRPG